MNNYTQAVLLSSSFFFSSAEEDVNDDDRDDDGDSLGLFLASNSCSEILKVGALSLPCFFSACFGSLSPCFLFGCDASLSLSRFLFICEASLVVIGAFGANREN